MTKPRGPRIFEPDDPAIKLKESQNDIGQPLTDDVDGATKSQAKPEAAPLTVSGILISALFGLVVLSLSVSFVNFLSTALARDDWIGWTATSLLMVVIGAAVILALREVSGLLRMRRVSKLRDLAQSAIDNPSQELERKTSRQLRALLRGRRDLAWGQARMKDFERDVQDPGDLLRLAEKELIAPLDLEARKVIVSSAKNVAVVSALSPLMWIAMIYVLVENLRMLRKLSAVYGAAPGLIGGLRLARMVFTHIVATGGIAMTDDLLGQFLGQDVLRRLSRRLGEGAFNGALTARIGIAAIYVTRPLPYIDAEPARLRDLLPDALRPLMGRFTKKAS